VRVEKRPRKEDGQDNFFCKSKRLRTAGYLSSGLYSPGTLGCIVNAPFAESISVQHSFSKEQAATNPTRMA
jgi:hypothetical protein